MRNIEDYEEQYMKLPFERYQEKYRRRLVKKVIAQYARRGGTILEIGCGILPLFADYQDEYLFTVIEPAKLCYNNACLLAKKYNNIVCYNAFLEDVIDKLQNVRFDIIICSSLLHEVENPQKLLHDIRCLCCKTTIVHVNVPNAMSIHRLLAKEMGLIRDEHQLTRVNQYLDQHTVFDMKMLRQLVNNENYQIVDEGSYFLKPFTHQQMQKCIDQHILNEDILDGLDSLCDLYMKEYGSEIYINMRLK